MAMSEMNRRPVHEPLLDKALYEILLDVALDPASGKADIFQALAEVLAVHHQGFAFLDSGSEPRKFVLQALFGTTGTMYIDGDQRDHTEVLYVTIGAEIVEQLDEVGMQTYASIDELGLDPTYPSTSRMAEAFQQDPVVLVQAWRADGAPSLILISSSEPGDVSEGVLADFSRRLSTALDIGRLKSNLIKLPVNGEQIKAYDLRSEEAELTSDEPKVRFLIPEENGEINLSKDPTLLVKRFADQLAAALTDANGPENSHKREAELAALYEMALEIARESDLRSLFRTTLQWATKLLDRMMGAVFLVDPTLDQIILAAERNLPDPPGVLYLEKGYGLAGKVWQRSEAVIFDHLRGQGDPQWIESCYATGAALGVPLLVEGQVHGVLAIFDPGTSSKFSKHDTSLLERIAAQVSLGIENVERNERINRRVNQLRVVHDLARRIGTILDLDQLYTEVVQRIANGFNVDMAVLFMVEDQELIEKASYHLTDDRFGAWAPLKLKIGEDGICGHAAQQGIPILSPDVSVDPHYVRVLPFERDMRSAVAVPLKLKGKVTGVLLAESGRLGAFDRTDIDALLALTAHVSTSIENARLYRETLQVHSRIDESEKLRSLGLMTSGIAHDFNNLLAVILSRTELALEIITDERAREHLVQVVASAKDGGETIQRLQEFARTRKNTSDFGAVDINHAAAEAIDLSEPMWKDQAQNNGIDISIVRDFRAKHPVLGAEVQLREVLVNLIFNAVEAMPQGGTIVISTSSNNQGIQISVRDTGVGMTQEVKEQIFVPFFTTKPGGTGLGMSMVYGVIKRHQGTIEIESQPDQGSTITIWLPSSPEEKTEGTELGMDHEPGLLTPISILVVEDENSIREVLCETFTEVGHTVFAAENGAVGFEKFLQLEHLDVVITDLGMPDLSGWELIEQLRVHDPNLPIIILSGWGDEIDPQKVERFQVTKVLGKPFTVDSLHAALYEVITLRRLAN